MRPSTHTYMGSYSRGLSLHRRIHVYFDKAPKEPISVTCQELLCACVPHAHASRVTRIPHGTVQCKLEFSLCTCLDLGMTILREEDIIRSQYTSEFRRWITRKGRTYLRVPNWAYYTQRTQTGVKGSDMNLNLKPTLIW